jgi:lysophospholipase L1-like esterase
MMKRLSLTFSILLTIFLAEYSYAQDWANLNRFKMQNAELGIPGANEQRVVFMGNSITEGWLSIRPEFFAGKPNVNRGIGGQTTPQMLLRFRQDVINLQPAVVVILAGINDIAGNTGPSTIDMITDNIFSMAELARSNNIKVVLCSVLPANDFSWNPGLQPAEKVVELNKRLKAYTEKYSMGYVDYFTPMANERNGLKIELGEDGVHPNAAGYAVMEPLLEDALAEVLIKK